MNAIAQAGLAVFVAGALVGCSSTTFDTVPVAEGSCDPRLVGDWHWVSDEKGKDTSPVELKVDNGCKRANVLIQASSDQKPTDETLSLHLGHEGIWNYAWVDLPQSNETNDPEESGFYVVRYRISGDKLELYLPDDDAIEKEIFDDKLFGTSHLHNGRKFRVVHNHIGDDIDLQTFHEKIMFLSKPWRFQRRNQTSTQ